MSRVRTYAAIIGVAVLGGASVHSGLLALRDTRRTFKAGTQDFAVAFRQRLSGVRTLLPERGTVGYVSDYNDEGEFYLTQYLLVPLILEKGQNPDLILVNNHIAGKTSRSESYAASPQSDGSVVYDFWNGIKLIDRRHER